MTADEILRKLPDGKVLKGPKGYMVLCPAHADKNPSLSVGFGDNGGVVLHCFAGCSTEQVCDKIGITLSDLFDKPIANGREYKPTQKPAAPAASPAKKDEKPLKLVKTYSYVDALGKEVYQVERYTPKTFRQRHWANGEWVWSMEGVERVLYGLPALLAATLVILVEGEKDADSLIELGFAATTNVGGAGKWLDGYTESLAGKEVVIIGDNDEPGRKHVRTVFDSINAKVKWVKIVEIPSSVKDVTDFIATFSDKNEAKKSLESLIEAAHAHYGGVKLPIRTMAEIEPKYRKQVLETQTTCLDLGKWLPSFRGKIRAIIPGELVLLIGDTGSGKTALASCIWESSGLATLIFELELPDELLFERLCALRMKVECQWIEQQYMGGHFIEREMLEHEFPKLAICTQSRLALPEIESIIIKSELKMGVKPKLVIIDYAQLVDGVGSRYEKMSAMAEGLKIMAKATNTIIVVTSQVARPKDDDPEIGLHSAKDSGSLESSAGLVLGAWRDSTDQTLMHLRVLKATKGGSGTHIECNFDGRKMTITERSKVHDVPTPTRRNQFSD